MCGDDNLCGAVTWLRATKLMFNVSTLNMSRNGKTFGERMREQPLWICAESDGSGGGDNQVYGFTNKVGYVSFCLCLVSHTVFASSIFSSSFFCSPAHHQIYFDINDIISLDSMPLYNLISICFFVLVFHLTACVMYEFAIGKVFFCSGFGCSHVAVADVETDFVLAHTVKMKALTNLCAV